MEGNELALLRGAAETLDRDRPVLLLEIERRHLSKYGVVPDDIIAFLAAYGYRMYVWQRRRWCPSSEVTTARRNYLFAVTEPG